MNGLTDVVTEAAVLLGAVTGVAALLWRWFVQPAFTREVEKVVEAKTAAAVAPVIHELSVNSGKSVKDVLIRVDERLAAHLRHHDHYGS